MKHHGIIPAFLIAAAVSCGVAHAENPPGEAQAEAAFRPWIGPLGVHFPSESLFEEPDERGGANGLSGQASAAGLQGLGFGSDWRPFRNGFRLSFAMYLESNEPDGSGGFRPQILSGDDPASEDPIPLDPISLARDFEAVPYVGLGWRTNDGGLDVNLDVGAFLPGEYPLRDGACLGPDSPLTGCGVASFGNGLGKLTGAFRRFEWYPVVSMGIEYRF